MHRWRREEQLNFKVELSVEQFFGFRLKHALLVLPTLVIMKSSAVNFSSKFNNISQANYFFSVSDKESLGHKACTLVKHLRFHQFMEVALGLILGRKVFAFVKIGWCKVNVVIIFMEDLKLQKVNSLLEQVNVAEMF
jgi:hypothetical protein